MPEVTHGGGIKNIVHGTWYGARRLCTRFWAWGHNDQRASWLMHWLICVAVSTVAAFVVWLEEPGKAQLGYAAMASLMFLVFLFRETGDEDYWRKKGMWDVLDKDRNWRGKLRLGVSRRFDKAGDLTGPFFNCGTAWMVWLFK